MTENIIILVLVGVFAAIAAPSMNQMLTNIELNQSVIKVQTYFTSAQRQARRDNKGCDVGVFGNQDPANPDESIAPLVGYGECLPEQFSPLAEKAVVVTNLKEPIAQVTSTAPSSVAKKSEAWCLHHADHKHFDRFCAQVQQVSQNFAQMFYDPEGGANFRVQSVSNYPIDASGKFVFYRPGNFHKKMPCLLMSSRFGLIRQGSYTGSLNPNEMTENGICKTSGWDKQTF